VRDHSPASIKQARIAERVDRLDPEYLAHWRTRYRIAHEDFVNGGISASGFTSRLMTLGFREDALRAEVTDAERFKKTPVRFRGLP